MRKQGKNLKYQMPLTFGTAESFLAGRDLMRSSVISLYPEITLEVCNIFLVDVIKRVPESRSCCSHSVPTLVANIS